MNIPAKTKGFTLIEVLVVLSIIALLASIIFVAVMNLRANGRYGAMISQMKQIVNSVESYYATDGLYPVEAIRSMPAGLSTWLPQWPGTPCKDPSLWAYDYEITGTGLGSTDYVVVRLQQNISGTWTNINRYCINRTDAGGCGLGTDVTNKSSGQLGC